jgi:plasmid stability protein
MEAPMAQLVVRNLEDDVKAKLQKRARLHGRSTEEEVRDILRNAVNEKGSKEPGLGTQIAALFEGIGLDEDISEQRGQPVRFPDFKK